MRGKVCRFIIVVQAAVISAYAGLLFQDTFDRTALDGADGQSGSIGNITYAAVNNAANTSPAAGIVSNRLVLSVGGGNGAQRLIPNHNFAVSDIVSAGGFEISYTVRSGIDFTGDILGSYSSKLYLGQKSIIENADASHANAYFPLAVVISGNGQVSVYAQSVPLVFNVPAKRFLRKGTNRIRLAVKTGGFSIRSKNAFSLYVNEELVHSGEFSWKAGHDFRFAVEAYAFSAEIDNLQLSTVEK